MTKCKCKCFIPNYNTIATPLTNLTKDSKPVRVIWTDATERAFTTLKSLLCTNPLLRMPDFKGLFTVFPDASETGIGAVLSQGEGGEAHPVVYISL